MTLCLSVLTATLITIHLQANLLVFLMEEQFCFRIPATAERAYAIPCVLFI